MKSFFGLGFDYLSSSNKNTKENSMRFQARSLLIRNLEVSGFLLMVVLCFELVETLPFQVPVHKKDAPKFRSLY